MLASTFSIFGLFGHADLFVQAITILIILASVWSWAIIINKVSMLRRVRKFTAVFEKRFKNSASLDDLFDALDNKPRDPMGALFVAAMQEWKLSLPEDQTVVPADKIESTLQRINQVMRVTLDRESNKMEIRMGFLATTGSVSPMVGLFGTVWGIMQSFAAMSSSQNSSLAAIAPGIATSLSTTAFGLIAAIPAVIAYNKIYAEIASFETRLQHFAEEFSVMVSRQLDAGVGNTTTATEQDVRAF
ncbi:MAG: protein TolQ [Deltaproteobacteria bacterium]|nr:MAG: protein TolQ [Deltaproteobacteria bacterium]